MLMKRIDDLMSRRKGGDAWVDCNSSDGKSVTAGMKIR